MTVPAHQWMWSAHDAANHHQRRYSIRQLRGLVEASPLRLEQSGYFNSLLFPLAIARAARLKASAQGGWRPQPPAELAQPIA